MDADVNWQGTTSGELSYYKLNLPIVLENKKKYSIKIKLYKTDWSQSFNNINDRIKAASYGDTIETMYTFDKN